MQLPSGRGPHPDPGRAIAQYRRRAEHYDFELIPFEPVRRSAIASLDLEAGATVIDIGCGTGLSFEPLKDRIGKPGHIVGVDPSPEMLAQARRRVQRHHWSGITLLEAGAGDAALPGRADAALFHFTHDVLQDEAAIAHVLAHLKPGAHVVAAGLQWGPAWSLPVNLLVLGAALYSVTCLGGLEKPWRLLTARLREAQVRAPTLGGFYIASGYV